MIGVLDAGTGIRNLGRDIMQRELAHNFITIAFTHFHWDHIQGLPFFEPAYSSDFVINLLALGQGRMVDDLEEVFAAQMKQEYFPIELQKMGAHFKFMLADKQDLTNFHGATMSTCKLVHPGGCYGYKMQVEDKKLVICTDVEHKNGIDPAVVEFAKGADILVHDAQYTTEELPKFRGWGHSSYEQAIEVAEQAGVERLIMTHHDPSHDDQFLSAIEKKCQDRLKHCLLAREGMEISIL
jgi:phosphoribosyl 1,2-cyclic phosphodiesterase